MKTVNGACPHDCPDTCAWQVDVDNKGTAISLRGHPEHPFTKGSLCTKLKRYINRVYHKDRILHPQKRVGLKGEGEFERISWEDALEIITSKLKGTIRDHGPLSAMPCNFAGTIGMLQRYAGDQFFERLGATDVDRSICGKVALDGIRYTIGAGDTVLPEDLKHSRYIIIWGSNTAVTNLHLWSGAIKEARHKGAKIVVIDPLKTPTAERSDWHLQIKPGTDAALALGMMHIIVRDGLQDEKYVKDHTVGFERLRDRIRKYTPELVSSLTGIGKEEIEKFSREYALTKPAVIRVLVGMERRLNGGLTLRTIACLPALVGAFKSLGGGICQFTINTMREALDYKAVIPQESQTPGKRIIHLAQLGRVLTDKNLSPPINWLMIYNLNPVVTLPNQNLILTGLKRDDLFTVVHEQFMTESAKYADILLPASTQLEHWDLMPSWGHTYVALNKPAIAPLGEAVANTELFRMLAKGMDFKEPYLLASDEERIRRLLDSKSPLVSGITLETLKTTGWAKLKTPTDWRPRAEGNFSTPSGKCEFFSKTLENLGLDPLPTFEITPSQNMEEYPLDFISPKATHFLNSEYVNLPNNVTIEHSPSLVMNTMDAQDRDILENDKVRIFNQYGEVVVKAKLSQNCLLGTVSMAFNWWMASSLNGSSANALTPDALSDLKFGSNAFDAKVQVMKV